MSEKNLWVRCENGRAGAPTVTHGVPSLHLFLGENARGVSLPLGLALAHPALQPQANSPFRKSTERSERLQRALIIIINMESRT